MRRMSVRVRCALFAIALLQSWSGAAFAIADGFLQARDVALPSHVEDQSASHNSRAHAHDCVACRELRSGHALPAAPRLARPVEAHGCAVATVPRVTPAERSSLESARAPPVGLVAGV